MGDVRPGAPVTLRMIADKAGVSVSTVSRVLSAEGTDAHRWAAAGTVELIRELARKRDYRRNPQAVGLRTNRSGLVGVLVPRLQDFVLATIYEGIEEAATENGLSTFVTNSLDVPANQIARTEMMLQRRVDGMIFGDRPHRRRVPGTDRRPAARAAHARLPAGGQPHLRGSCNRFAPASQPRRARAAPDVAFGHRRSGAREPAASHGRHRNRHRAP